MLTTDKETSTSFLQEWDQEVITILKWTSTQCNQFDRCHHLALIMANLHPDLKWAQQEFKTFKNHLCKYKNTVKVNMKIYLTALCQPKMRVLVDQIGLLTKE